MVRVILEVMLNDFRADSLLLVDEPTGQGAVEQVLQRLLAERKGEDNSRHTSAFQRKNGQDGECRGMAGVEGGL